MKLWTVQDKAILNLIAKDGVYYPDFAKSRFVAENPALSELYGTVLKAFNTNNSADYAGLIFAFAQHDNQRISEIRDFDEFQMVIRKGRPVLGSLWNSLQKKDCVVLELEYKEYFNPIFIDLNDFQFLMPPVMAMYPYSRLDDYMIPRNIMNGIVDSSRMPSYIAHAHTPYIAVENIVCAYPMFDI